MMNIENEQIQKIKQTVIAVITNPSGFFKDMPVTGGLGDPIIFLAAMGFVSGVIQAFLSILGLGFKVSFFMALASIIFVPLMVVIFSFIGAGIFFVIFGNTNIIPIVSRTRPIIIYISLPCKFSDHHDDFP